MGQPKGKRPRRRTEGYIHKSPAVCIVVHDPTGKPMPNAMATEIINTVSELAMKNGYLINFTRT